MSKIRSMALEILFPAKDYCNRNSKSTFERTNDIINNKKYEEEEEEEEKETKILVGWLVS